MAWIVAAPFRRGAFVLVFLIVGAAVFETLGIGMVMPLFETVLKSGDAPSDSRLFAFAFRRIPPHLHLLVVCAATLGVVFLKATFVILMTYFSARFIGNLRKHWSAQIFEGYLFSRYSIFMKGKKGVVVNNVVNEPMHGSKALREVIDSVADSLVSLCIVILLLWVSWRVTLVTILLAIPVMGLLWRFTSKYSVDVGRRRLRLNQQIAHLAVEGIGGTRQLKIFSIESPAAQNLADKLERLTRLNNRFSVVSRLPQEACEVLIIVLLVSFFLVYGFVLRMDVSDVLPMMGLFALSALKLFSSVSRLMSKRMSIISYLPSLTLISDLLEDLRSNREPEGKSFLNGVIDCIDFSAVSYKLDDGNNLFSGVCLTMKKGKITAIVGPSGAGKSTLCDLTTQICLPASGAILVDGGDLSQLERKSWRQRIGYVSQDSFLFNASVRENIKVGCPSATDAEVLKAAKLAHAHGFIEKLSDAYDTVIGEGGVSLSGGERQRIAIARALIRDPDIVIFDEATSALDSESERFVLESLRKLAPEKIVLFVTHRLSSLWVADFIYFLDRGGVQEAGTYEELLAKEGNFSRFVTLFQGAQDYQLNPA